jgi:hypothetical protein
MPADAEHGEGARLLCVAIQYAAPILSQIVRLVHELRAHPHPKVRAIALEKLPAPQRLDANGLPRGD